MPISLVHVVEVKHQSLATFTVKQLTTALIANQIRMVTKPSESTIFENYNELGVKFLGRTNRAAYEQAVEFGKNENLTVNAEHYRYSVKCFDITVILTEKVEVCLKFLNLDDAEKAYVELLTAASLSQVAQEKTA